MLNGQKVERGETKVFSAKVRKLIVFDFTFKGLISIFGVGEHESGQEKSHQWRIKRQHVNFPENFNIAF